MYEIFSHYCDKIINPIMMGNTSECVIEYLNLLITPCSTEEIFFQNILVILKHLLQN